MVQRDVRIFIRALFDNKGIKQARQNLNKLHGQIKSSFTKANEKNVTDFNDSLRATNARLKPLNRRIVKTKKGFGILNTVTGKVRKTNKGLQGAIENYQTLQTDAILSTKKRVSQAKDWRKEGGYTNEMLMKQVGNLKATASQQAIMQRQLQGTIDPMTRINAAYSNINSVQQAFRIGAQQTGADVGELQRAFKESGMIIDTQRKKAINPASGAVQEIGNAMFQARKKAKRFRFEMLSVMFFGMAMQNAFGGMTQSMLKVTGASDALGTAMMALGVRSTLGKQVYKGMYGLTDTLLGLPGPIQDIIGSLGVLTETAGGTMMRIGMLTLGLQGLARTPLGPILRKIPGVGMLMPSPLGGGMFDQTARVNFRRGTVGGKLLNWFSKKGKWLWGTVKSKLSLLKGAIGSGARAFFSWGGWRSAKEGIGKVISKLHMRKGQFGSSAGTFFDWGGWKKAKQGIGKVKSKITLIGEAVGDKAAKFFSWTAGWLSKLKETTVEITMSLANAVSSFAAIAGAKVVKFLQWLRSNPTIWIKVGIIILFIKMLKDVIETYGKFFTQEPPSIKEIREEREKWRTEGPELGLIDMIKQFIPGLQRGGIITRPTPAIVGEAGPEAIIPLDRVGTLGGNVDASLNIGEVNINEAADIDRIASELGDRWEEEVRARTGGI